MAKRTDLWDIPTTVYWFYDQDEAIIYVGMTSNLPARLAQHRARRWFPDVTRIETKLHPDRRSARKAERRLILRHGPKHNSCAEARRARARLNPAPIVSANLPDGPLVYGWTDFDPDNLPPAHWKMARGLLRGQGQGTVMPRRAIQARAALSAPVRQMVAPEVVAATRPPFSPSHRTRVMKSM